MGVIFIIINIKMIVILPWDNNHQFNKESKNIMWFQLINNKKKKFPMFKLVEMVLIVEINNNNMKNITIIMINKLDKLVIVTIKMGIIIRRVSWII